MYNTLGICALATYHTDPGASVAVDENALPNPYATGYGRKAPTPYRLQLRFTGDKQARWHRVYVMVYGNGGSAYILRKGNELFLSSEIEELIYAEREK